MLLQSSIISISLERIKEKKKKKTKYSRFSNTDDNIFRPFSSFFIWFLFQYVFSILALIFSLKSLRFHFNWWSSQLCECVHWRQNCKTIWTFQWNFNNFFPFFLIFFFISFILFLLLCVCVCSSINWSETFLLFGSTIFTAEIVAGCLHCSLYDYLSLFPIQSKLWPCITNLHSEGREKYQWKCIFETFWKTLYPQKSQWTKNEQQKRQKNENKNKCTKKKTEKTIRMKNTPKTISKSYFQNAQIF